MEPKTDHAVQKMASKMNGQKMASRPDERLCRRLRQVGASVLPQKVYESRSGEMLHGVTESLALKENGREAQTRQALHGAKSSSR